jgi:hypothetical protein
MPRALLRKLTDVTTGEQLADIQERLHKERIPIEFHICGSEGFDCYRIFVYVMHLRRAKEILGVSK